MLEIVGRFTNYSRDFLTDESRVSFSTNYELPADELLQLQEKELKITVKEYRKRRSTDANACYWAQLGKLARKLKIPAEDIYKRHIKDMSNYQVLCMSEKAVSSFEEMWCSDHIGRFVETRASRLEGCVTVLAYYGSSDFNTKEMSVLIENLMEDCREAGVSTIPDKEVERLLRTWKA